MKVVLAFGAECINFINTEDEKNSYEYFKNIKMNLYKKSFFIKSTNAKVCNIEKIIAKILVIVSQHPY